MTIFPCKRRIHISPVGFEVDRVVLPLEKYKADKVWLLAEESEEKDEGKNFLNQVIERIEAFSHPCSYKTIKHDVVNRDLFSAMRLFREIIEGEVDHQIFVNVSTGTKIQAIAGMMACMMFNDGESHPVPYYVVPEEYTEQRKKDEQMTRGCKDVICLPNYRIERPDGQLIRTLEVMTKLSSADIPITKKELNNALVERGIIKGEKIEKSLDQNKKVSAYQKLDRKIITPLQDSWKCINIQGTGRGARLSITEDGLNILTFLGEKTDP